MHILYILATISIQKGNTVGCALELVFLLVTAHLNH